MSNDGLGPSRNNASGSKPNTPQRSTSPSSHSITQLVAQNFQQTMRRAFWDLMYEQLRTTPPNLDTAFQLLQDIKSGLLGLLPKRKTSLQERISEIFNFPTLRAQAEQNAIDISNLLTKVTVLMGEMCAPARDDQLKQIKERLEQHQDASDAARNYVTIFRSILEFIDLMQDDFRTLVRQHTNPVDMHRAQFQAYLATGARPEIVIGWLKKARTELGGAVTGLDGAVEPSPASTEAGVESESGPGTKVIFVKAFTKILILDLQQPMPETIVDEVVERCRMFSIEVRSVALLTALVLLIKQAVGACNCAEVSSAVRAILSDIGSSQNQTIESRLENVSSWANDKFPDTSEHTRRSLANSFKEIAKADALEKHPVLKLVVDRICQYSSQCLMAALNKQTLPGIPGIATTTGTNNDIGYITNDFVKIFLQNFITFEQLYNEILSKV